MLQLSDPESNKKSHGGPTTYVRKAQPETEVHPHPWSSEEGPARNRESSPNFGAIGKTHPDTEKSSFSSKVSTKPARTELLASPLSMCQQNGKKAEPQALPSVTLGAIVPVGAPQRNRHPLLMAGIKNESTEEVRRAKQPKAVDPTAEQRACMAKNHW